MGEKNKVSNSDTWNILEIVTDLTSNLDIDAILTKINNSAGRLVSAEGASVLLFDDGKQCLRFIVASGEKAHILHRVTVRDGVAWDVAQSGEATIVNDTASDPRFTGTVDEVTAFKTKSILCVPVILNGEVLGVLEAVNKIAEATFTEADKRLFAILADQIAVVMNNARMAEDQQNFFTNSIEIFAKAIEAVGIMMGLMSWGHCWRVAELSTAMGQKLGISDSSFGDLYYGAILHDMGLLEQQRGEFILFETFGLSPVLERSEGSLRIEPFQEQWDLGVWGDVKSHPVAGANIVKNINLLRGATPIIRHHHEHFDGTGYPDGLKGDNVPLGARIVAVAETYEEMLLGSLKTELKYKKSAIEGIKKSSGTMLEPLVVDVFLSVIDGE